MPGLRRTTAAADVGVSPAVEEVDVIGHAVMTVRYDSYQGPKFSLQRVAYRAWVKWNNGSPVLDGDLRPTSIKLKKPVVKQGAGEAASLIVPTVRAAFAQCALSHEIPMPPTCPQDPLLLPGQSNVTWTFDGDPVQNTSQRPDTAWGLIHVTGNFAMKAQYGDLLGNETKREAGAYDAVLVVDSLGVKVLQIKKQ